MSVIEVTGKLVLNPKAHGPWCQMSYPNHPHGCPNFGRRSDCPPEVAMIDAVFDLSRPHWFIVEPFDLKAQMERMKGLHPAWTARQQRNCRYWQGGARRRLRTQITAFIGFRPLFWTMTPEAMGINVLQTARRVGIPIETAQEHGVQDSLCGVCTMKPDDPLYISLCKTCWCMTKTVRGKCGKCGATKDPDAKV